MELESFLVLYGLRLSYVAYTAKLQVSFIMTFLLHKHFSLIQKLQRLSATAQMARRIKPTDVGHWISANRLKLNTDKTEFIWVISQQRCHLPLLHVGSPVQLRSTPCPSARCNTRLTLASIAPATSSARPASTGYGSYGVLRGHWTRIQP